MGKFLTTLTSPGVSEVLDVQQFKQHLIQATLSNVQTSVTIRVEGSVDRVVWENLDEEDLTWSLDDIYNLIITEDRPIEFLRFNWVSESGGPGAQMKLFYTGRY